MCFILHHGFASPLGAREAQCYIHWPQAPNPLQLEQMTLELHKLWHCKTSCASAKTHLWLSPLRWTLKRSCHHSLELLSLEWRLLILSYCVEACQSRMTNGLAIHRHTMYRYAQDMHKICTKYAQYSCGHTAHAGETNKLHNTSASGLHWLLSEPGLATKSFLSTKITRATKDTYEICCTTRWNMTGGQRGLYL